MTRSRNRPGNNPSRTATCTSDIPGRQVPGGIIRTMIKAIAGLSLVVLAAGCASYVVPSELSAVRLVGVSSAGVEIYRPRFIRQKGGLALEAYVMREFKGQTTTHSHVDIVFLDRAGRKIAEERANVRPADLPVHWRLPRPHHHFIHAMNPPAGTEAVEVRAHEVPHI